MIFMHNETGSMFEMLILSLDDSNNEVFREDNITAYRVGKITMVGAGSVRAASMLDFANLFTFIGWI